MHKAWIFTLLGAGVFQSTLRADPVSTGDVLPTGARAFTATNFCLSLAAGQDAVQAANRLMLSADASAATLSLGLFRGPWAAGSALVADSFTLSQPLFKYWNNYPVAGAVSTSQNFPLYVTAPTVPASQTLALNALALSQTTLQVPAQPAPSTSLAAPVVEPAETAVTGLDTPAELPAIGAFEPRAHLNAGTTSNIFLISSPLPSPVPEPASLALLGLGLAALRSARRSRPAA